MFYSKPRGTAKYLNPDEEAELMMTPNMRHRRSFDRNELGRTGVTVVG
jgi:hypothetical protein